MRMLNVFIWIAVLAALAAPFPAGAQDQAAAPAVKPPAAKIVCDQPVYEFGEVENSRDVEHTFVIRNDGNLSLEISAVRATCGCTATEVTSKLIAPGETAEIRAKLNLRGRQGRQRKAIMVHSSDPATPMLTLYFDGTATTGMDLRPRQIFFGRISSDSVVTGGVELVVQSNREVKLTKIESGSPLLSATNTVAADGRSYQISVTTVPPLPKGTFRGSVRIETDHPQYPSMDVVVSGFVVSDVTYAPQELVLPEQPEVGVTRYILVRSESDKPFQIVSVEAPLPEIEALVQPTGPSAYRIEVRNIKATKELNGAAIRVNTTLVETPQFSIPLRIIPQG